MFEAANYAARYRARVPVPQLGFERRHDGPGAQCRWRLGNVLARPDGLRGAGKYPALRERHRKRGEDSGDCEPEFPSPRLIPHTQRVMARRHTQTDEAGREYARILRFAVEHRSPVRMPGGFE